MEELYELILGLLPKYSAKNGMTVKEIVARLTTSDGQMDLGFASDGTPQGQTSLFSYTEKDATKALSLLFKDKKISKKKGKNGAWTYKIHKPTTPLPPPPPPPIDKMYVGKGGEYAVMAELLFNGYNANPMTVDEGVDVVASKNNVFYYIQVKTTFLDENRVARVQIKKQSFENVRADQVIYIVAIREDKGKLDFFVFSQRDIDRLEKQKEIVVTDSSISIKIRFEERDNLPYLYTDTKKTDASWYRNNFSFN